MSDLRGLSRLREEQEKSLQNCNDMIRKWEKFKKDYESVGKLLRDLPKKTAHDVMVPIGPLAFMPGKLIHTNEIMVLLGDNWFAERSASQAVDITKRRLKSVEEYLGDLKKEHSNILSHMAFSSDIINVKNQVDHQEIKEELTTKDKRRQDAKKSGRVAHAKATKGSVKKVDLQTGTSNRTMKLTKDDQNLFARLDELEKEEQSHLEMESKNTLIDTNTNKGDNGDELPREIDVFRQNNTAKVHTEPSQKQNPKKKVSWKTDIVETPHEKIAAVPKENKTTIYFTHSYNKISDEKDAPTDEKLINSPADIYNQYLRSNDLKKQQRNPQPFSDVVVEHKDVSSLKIQPDLNQSEPSEKRIVSKFKARRTKNDVG